MKTGLFFVLAGSIFAGIAVGLTATDSWFLAKAGADNLPMVYLATPLVMVLYTLVVTALCYLTSMTFVLLGSLLGIGAAACAVGYVLNSQPEMGETLPFIFGVKILVNVWLYAAFTQMWNFISGYIDINTGKREFPRFNAASAVGLMIGAGTVAALSQRVSLASFYFVWGSLCFVSAAVTAGIAIRLTPLQRVQSPVVREEGWLRAAGAVLFSRYALLLGISAMVVLAITVLCEWLSFRHFNVYAMEKARASLPIGAALTDLGNHASRTLQKLLGSLGVITGGLVLVINLFVFSPMVKRLGVGNSILIQPILYASAFVALALAQGFYAAVWSLLIFQGFFVALDANTRNFLFNALPGANRVMIRNFIEGIIEPWAAAFVGIFLFWGAILPDGTQDTAGQWLNKFFGLPLDWLSQWGGRTLDPTEISVIAFILAVVSFVAALLIRWLYPKAIAANFLDGVFNPSVPAIPSSNGAAEHEPQPTPATKRRTSSPEQIATELAKALPICPAATDPAWTGILALKGPLAAKTIFAVAHKLTALGTLQALERLRTVDLIAVPWCMGVLRSHEETVSAKLLAIEALAKISPYQLEAAHEELLSNHFAKAKSYHLWKNGASNHRLATLTAVAEKLRAAEVQVILTLLHHTGRVPAPTLVRIALASSDVQERADMLETLGIALENPERLELIAGGVDGEIVESTQLRDLLLQPSERVPEALAAAIIWDLPEWGVKWAPLSTVLSAERENSRHKIGPWQRRLAVATSPIMEGARWEAIELLTPEVTSPTSDPKGLWITVDTGAEGPMGTCLNPGWLAGQSEIASIPTDNPRVLELSTDWLKRLSLLCPDLPLHWVGMIRQAGF